MNISPEISIIMPVYNSAEYLKDSIGSVLSQDFNNYELILVDDGSTDNSGTICDIYAEKHSNVITIHKENNGLCSARNRGLDIARGKYVMFMDNDDEYIGNDVFSFLCCQAEKGEVDWIRFSRLRTTIIGKKKMDDIDGVKGIKDNEDWFILSKKNCLENYWTIKKSGALYGVWNAMYKRSVIQDGNLKFDETIRCGGEDWKFNLQYFALCNKILFVQKAFYHYYRRAHHSISVKYDYNRIESIIWVAETENSLLIKNPEIELNDSLIRVKLASLYQQFCCAVMINNKCDLDYVSKKDIFSKINDIFNMSNHEFFENFSIIMKNKKITLSYYLRNNLFGFYSFMYRVKVLKDNII